MPDAQTHFTMFGVVLLTSTFVALAGARIYERCELARDLLKLGVNRDHVATWVCIAFHESRFDTAARNPHSGDHGLLQISELYWCGPGKACGVPCSAFRNDDISDDVQCALRIHEEHTRLQGNGFLAWVVYPHHCKHNAKKYLADCDTSVKSQIKLDDRARYLKSFEINVTSPSIDNYQSVNKLKPNYLAISELFKGNYVKQFEENYYNNKAPLSWINFKIDNIDKLKLPNVNRNNNFQFTTPSTTTTTIDPTLIGIKPPSPRRIESNQFRRRNMNLISVSTKNIDKYDYVPRKTFIEVSLANKMYEKIDLSQNPFINLQKISSKTSTETPYHTRGLSSYTPNYLNIFTLTTPRTITSTVSTTLTTSEKPVSTQKQSYNSHTITPNLITSRRSKFRYVPNSNYDYTTTQRPSTTTSTTSTTDSSVNLTTRMNIDFKIPVNNSKLDDQHKIELPETTTLRQTTNISNDNSNKSVEVIEAKHAFSLAESSSDITQKYETTPIPQTTSTTSKTSQSLRLYWDNSRNIHTTSQPQTTSTTTVRSFTPTTLETTPKPQTTPKPLTTSTPSKTSRSPRLYWDTRNVQTTTSNPRTTSTTTSRTFTTTTTLASASQKLVSSTQFTPVVTPNATTESAPTMKTTWSIFDLYLNPTKATIKPFKFTPFKNGPFKLSIFSGGTTTPPPSFFTLKKN